MIPLRHRHGGPTGALGARGAAFTLMELLVTIALLVLILYLLATTFHAASIAFNRTRITVEANQNIRAAMDILHDDLVGATLVSTGQDLSLNQRRWRFLGVNGASNRDEITFTTMTFQSARSAPGAAQPERPQVVEVRYFINGNKLMKEVDWDNDLAASAPDPAEAVCFSVKSMDVRYFDRNPSGTPGWTADGQWPDTLYRLPVAVEITLTVTSTDNTGRVTDTTASQVIYLRGSETQG